MLILLFFILAAAGTDCYYMHKAEILPCLLMADVDHNEILNRTEINNFTNGTAWKADAILFLMNKTDTLVLDDWDTVNSPGVLFQICMFCKHNKNYF